MTIENHIKDEKPYPFTYLLSVGSIEKLRNF